LHGQCSLGKQNYVDYTDTIQLTNYFYTKLLIESLSTSENKTDALKTLLNVVWQWQTKVLGKLSRMARWSQAKVDSQEQNELEQGFNRRKFIGTSLTGKC